jgi:hypothetical protein
MEYLMKHLFVRFANPKIQDTVSNHFPLGRFIWNSTLQLCELQIKLSQFEEEKHFIRF